MDPLQYDRWFRIVSLVAAVVGVALVGLRLSTVAIVGILLIILSVISFLVVVRNVMTEPVGA